MWTADQVPTAAPGAYWRELLADAVEAQGTHWSITELLGAVTTCDAGLVDVAGWVCDELAMGRVQAVDEAWPPRFELVPGSRPRR